MGIPQLNAMCWKRLLSGQMPQFHTKHAALMLLIKKLQSSGDDIDVRAKALSDFFVKYERVLANEINQLTH